MSELSDATPTLPGELLRQAREQRELTAREVAGQLNWPQTWLDAIEGDRHCELSNPRFGRGYVRAYARLLGCDGEAMDKALAALVARDEDLYRARCGSRRPPQLHRSRFAATTGLTVLAVMVASLWWFQSQGSAGFTPFGQAGSVTHETSSVRSGTGEE